MFIVELLFISDYVGWEGIYCDVDTDGCADFDCFEGVECEDVPAPGVGAVCGPCPDGFYGDGAKCAGKRKCVKFDEVKFVIHGTR